MKVSALLVAAALVIPSASFAQETGGPPGGGRMGGGRMGAGMMQNTIEWLLTQKEQFRPTAEQVTKLEASAKALNDSIAKGREEIRNLREKAMNDGGDRREAFEKMRPMMEAIRKQDDVATKEAVKVLNSEQQKVVNELLDQHRKEMESRRRGFGGGPGGRQR